ncbi:NAD(P)-binding domain-containing protein [Microbacterium sp. NPDC091662]|uniref:NAD(P)-binding domain-containing protein n=1 Tax=Microbacterium sp. NPDC091662 TaxID=3364211 RepID=UPI00382E33CD
MDTNIDTNTPVTVIGLGEMGTAIAEALIERGHRTTVWNRTASRSAPLVAIGAEAAPTAAAAVAASPLIVVCLLDGDAVDAVRGTLDADMRDKVVVNVTSGSPAAARRTAEWASAHGAKYVDGGIMGDVSRVGTPDVLFSFSGDHDGYEAHRPVLEGLGTIAYFGEDPGFAAVEFLAQVAVGYEFLLGLLHTFALVKAEGADVTAFADRVAGSIGGYVPLVKSFGAAVSTREYGPDLGPLSVQAALMDDLISHRESLDIDTVRMREVQRLMDRRISDGHGDQGFSSLFELLDDSRPRRRMGDDVIPFGPQLIGQTEKALNALLQIVLSGRDLTERQWMSLRLASQLDDGDDLDTFVAARLHGPDVGRLLASLRDRGLIAGSALSASGAALVAEIGREIADLTGSLWEGIDERESQAATRVLNHVLEEARMLLRASTA